MPKIRLILIALFGMFLLGCSTSSNRNSASPGKKDGDQVRERCPRGSCRVFRGSGKNRGSAQESTKKKWSWLMVWNGLFGRKTKKTKGAVEKTKEKTGIFGLVRNSMFVRKTKIKNWGQVRANWGVDRRTLVWTSYRLIQTQKHERRKHFWNSVGHK